MFDLTKIRDTAMREGMKIMQDPRFTRLMQDPRAQKLMMAAFQLPGQIEATFARQGKAFARRFKLATREDVEALKSTIRDLERSLRDAQSKR